MTARHIHTLIAGGGQAALAMSFHLREHHCPHLILERHRLAEHWRTRRWDSLRANGPAWHDRFPVQEFDGIKGSEFATRDQVVDYFDAFARSIDAPIQCGVNVERVTRTDEGLLVETSDGHYLAEHVVAATGPFQIPVIPPLVPAAYDVKQLHSAEYRNPGQLPDGAVLVVGAGSSGAQIADELLRAGRRTFLSVGPHDRPFRRYRGKDFVWWLRTLGKWQVKTPPAGREHVSIAVSGAYGGETVDFRRFARRGMTLLGMTQDFQHGRLRFAPDLADTITAGDENHLALMREADAWIKREGLRTPPEPDAHRLGPDPDCIREPILELDLARENIRCILWATGYRSDFSWLQVDGAVDEHDQPRHQRGVSAARGVHFLGLPWLSMRGSSFIWGVWEDAKYLAAHIAAQ